MSKSKCPKCGNPKKAWFKLCFSCDEKEKQKPTCEICGIDVPEGHTLCKPHWIEKTEAKKKLRGIDYIKEKKKTEFKEKYEGKYYFNSQKVKSKSELLICYFLEANKVQFQYEPLMDIGGEVRPDFVMDDGKGHTVILEHFGLDDEEYRKKCEAKIRKYKQFCDENKEFFFIQTSEEDMKNLKEKLGKKLNSTPLKKAIWK